MTEASTTNSCDWRLVGEKFDRLLVAASNLIERNTPTRLLRVEGADMLVLSQLRIAINTCDAIRYLIAHKPPDPDRRPQFVLVSPVLERSIVDVLCNLIFLFNDLEANTSRYWKATWREHTEEHSRFEKTYGHLPQWAEWLSGRQTFIAKMKTAHKITSGEEAKPNLIPYWPIPNQMARNADLCDKRRDFLQYLIDWYYRIRSSAAHASGRGMLNHAVPLIGDESKERADLLEQTRSENMFASVTLMLAVVSELESELNLGLAERALYLWTLVGEYCPDAKEVYERRYQALL